MSHASNAGCLSFVIRPHYKNHISYLHVEMWWHYTTAAWYHSLDSTVWYNNNRAACYRWELIKYGWIQGNGRRASISFFHMPWDRRDLQCQPSMRIVNWLLISLYVWYQFYISKCGAFLYLYKCWLCLDTWGKSTFVLCIQMFRTEIDKTFQVCCESIWFILCPVVSVVTNDSYTGGADLWSRTEGYSAMPKIHGILRLILLHNDVMLWEHFLHYRPWCYHSC